MHSRTREWIDASGRGGAPCEKKSLELPTNSNLGRFRDRRWAVTWPSAGRFLTAYGQHARAADTDAPSARPVTGGAAVRSHRVTPPKRLSASRLATGQRSTLARNIRNGHTATSSGDAIKNAEAQQCMRSRP